MKPLEMLYLHFLNNLSTEINIPITSESLGYKWFDIDNCMGTSKRHRTVGPTETP